MLAALYPLNRVFTNWINMKLSAVGVEPISELHGENNELKSGLKLKAVVGSQNHFITTPSLPLFEL